MFFVLGVTELDMGDIIVFTLLYTIINRLKRRHYGVFTAYRRIYSAYCGCGYFLEGSSSIAKLLKIPAIIIGLTVVAIGTSLPELVTSMVAAKKGESDLALGNVIGSNIFNIIFILGFSSVLSPMTVDVLTIYDILILVGVSVVCWFFCKSKKKVSRLEGGIMLAMYVVYFVYILLRLKL